MGNILARCESRIAVRRGEAIPRTNRLANIASKNPIANEGTKIGWNIVFQFNRQIGNATPRINRSIRKNTLRRTGFDATRTSAALIGLEWRIRLKFNAKQNLRQKKIGTVVRINKAGIFANPSQACTLG